ncbi:hypothetical protein ACFE04_011460 [Oxalis oulophora]
MFHRWTAGTGGFYLMMLLLRSFGRAREDLLTRSGLPRIIPALLRRKIRARDDHADRDESLPGTGKKKGHSKGIAVKASSKTFLMRCLFSGADERKGNVSFSLPQEAYSCSPWPFLMCAVKGMSFFGSQPSIRRKHGIIPLLLDLPDIHSPALAKRAFYASMPSSASIRGKDPFLFPIQTSKAPRSPSLTKL